MSTRRFLGALAVLLALLALAAAAVEPSPANAQSQTPIPIRPLVEVTPDEWLDGVNHYRRASALPVVAERSEWPDGIVKHLEYLAFTPSELRTGEYANAHTENPDSQWYTPEGDAAGRSSNLVFGATPRDAIEGWMTAPFHAIGILAPSCWRSPSGR